MADVFPAAVASWVFTLLAGSIYRPLTSEGLGNAAPPLVLSVLPEKLSKLLFLHSPSVKRALSHFNSED